MRNCRTPAAAVLVLLLAGLSACAPPEPGPTATAAPPVSGINAANFDDRERPQDNFFAWVNGGWLARTEIPPDRSNWGTFTRLAEQAQHNLRAIVEELDTQGKLAPGSPEQKIRDLYASFMDETAVNAAGVSPTARWLARIDAISTPQELTAFLALAGTLNIAVPLGAYVDQDGKNATRYITHVSQWGLGMPDRDYYLGDDERLVAVRAEYARYVNALFALADLAEGNTAADVIAFETALARAQWTRVKNRDRNLTYNLYKRADLDALAPQIPWSVFLGESGLGDIDELVIRQPDYLTAVGQQLASAPLDTWKVYLRFQLLDAMAPYMSNDFVQAHFEFHGRTLSGTEQIRDRWKRGISMVNRTVGELLGQLYVRRHFAPEAKARMVGLVDNLRESFRMAIDELEWMTPATRAEAHAKLSKLGTKIGYPDTWRDYTALQIQPDDLVGNLLRASVFEHQRQIDRLGGPIDRTEWFLTPQTVNAYYSPKMNEIVFPAAILQPPFFNFAADDAVNYGAIGAVIGHEISHGFDDQGRKSDGDGNLRDWWTEADEREFNARAQRLVKQYSAYEPLPGMFINGELTLGENIGDLSGLAVAWRAWQLSLDGKPGAEIDGYSGAERFFIGWAQAWQTKQRDAALQRQLLTDPHSPAPYRAIGVLKNMDSFHATFDVAPGDGMYLPPAERVRLW